MYPLHLSCYCTTTMPLCTSTTVTRNNVGKIEIENGPPEDLRETHNAVSAQRTHDRHQQIQQNWSRDDL